MFSWCKNRQQRLLKQINSARTNGIICKYENTLLHKDELSGSPISAGMGTPTLSITNSKGIQVNLLNETPMKKIKYRYHCTEKGCQKSFTTSGHLARHNRIHTGEKNFHCLYPGCPSRFSRQDNMMQHYRTHLSSRSRQTSYTAPPPPKPYAHSYFHGSEKMELYPLYPPSHLYSSNCSNSEYLPRTAASQQSEIKFQSSSCFY
ncbi:hypothetical protein K501DRAFT_337588 [Backusella circina FSU 941]|nr:hypothetical protein K501DRAFT_337588 [Backusella circina FSU 941]